MVEVRALGAHFNLLQTPILGRRPQQRRPPLLSIMHQDIYSMSLVHDLGLFPLPRPPARRRRRHLSAFAPRQPPHATATQYTLEAKNDVWVACRARTQTFGAGFQR